MKVQDPKLIWDPDILNGSNRFEHTKVHFSKANVCSDLYLALIIDLSEAAQVRHGQAQDLFLCIQSFTFNPVGEKVRSQLRKHLFGIV